MEGIEFTGNIQAFITDPNTIIEGTISGAESSGISWEEVGDSKKKWQKVMISSIGLQIGSHHYQTGGTVNDHSYNYNKKNKTGTISTSDGIWLIKEGMVKYLKKDTVYDSIDGKRAKERVSEQKDDELEPNIVPITMLSPPNPTLDNPIEPKSVETGKKEGFCVVCWEKKSCVMVDPCNHLAMCEVCAPKVVDLCPLCRGKMNKKVKLFLT